MDNLTQYLIISGLSSSLLFGLYYTILRKETVFAVNRLILIFSLVISLVIPLFDFNAWFSTTGSSNQFVVFLDKITITSQMPGNESRYIVDYLSIINFVYFSGVVVFTFRLIFQLFRLIYLIRGNLKSIQYYNNTKLYLIFTKKDIGSFSVFNFVVIPEQKRDDFEFNAILKHELAHIKLHHSWDLLFLEITGIVLWFNPLIRFYKSELKSIHEFQADKQVLNAGTRLVQYQQFLLEQSFGYKYIAVNYFNRSLIKKRIKMMTTIRSRRRALVKSLFSLPVFLIIPFLISCSMKQEDNLEELKQSDQITQTETQVESGEAVTVAVTKASIYEIVPVMPKFPGGDKARVKYFVENIKYPEEARKKGTQGTVFVSFVVSKEGKIMDVALIRGIGDGCDKESIRVISEMPTWEPGRNEQGEPVNVKFAMPVKFRLN